MEYKPGDGKILQQTFETLDTETDYVPYGSLRQYQKDKWEKLAEEFLSKLEEDC